MQYKTCRPIWLLVVSLLIALATASVLSPVKRQDGAVTTTTANRISTTTTAEVSGTTTSPSNSTTSAATTTAPATTSATVTNGVFNITIPEGELPLDPRITPGWGVAGVILVGTGAVYTLTGIKVQWLHTFLSAAYLTALGTSVLIIYVMVPPISDGIQGAYVVAVVLTGVTLGGLAVVFKEITECLACLLGGFCLSMWLLTLHDGGLLTATNSKVGFIAALSLGAFAFYFSRWTRHYAIIISTSFSGATAIVLGIDAFSRAGLKEFWAYIWTLNDRLFPLGAVTYPLTRGIRVEIAVNIVVFLAGIISQLKLWILIKQHREKKNTERQEAQRNLDEEEAQVGRNIEESTAADRMHWEAVYGNGQGQNEDSEQKAHSFGSTGMSGTDEKKVLVGQVTSVPSAAIQALAAETPTEFHEMSAEDNTTKSPKDDAETESVLIKSKEPGKVTVRVAADETIQEPEEAEVDESLMTSERRQIRMAARGVKTTPEPTVVPLPFKTPLPQDSAVEDEDDARSSVAAFMGDGDEADSGMRGRRESFANRLSQTSMGLLKSLSQRSRRSTVGISRHMGESREGLVASRPATRDDRSSIAATVDGMSLHEDSGTIRDLGGPLTAGDVASSVKKASTDIDAAKGGAPPLPDGDAIPMETAGSAPTKPPSEEKEKSIKSGSATKSVSAEAAEERQSASNYSQQSNKLQRASLVKSLLPSPMSKVALSYRTNEWTKHLGAAETPELEELQLQETTDSSESELKAEEAVPVKSEELQQTANDAVPPPAITRPPSTKPPNAISQLPSQQPLYQENQTWDRGVTPSPMSHLHKRMSISRHPSGSFSIPTIEGGSPAGVRSVSTPLQQQQQHHKSTGSTGSLAMTPEAMLGMQRSGSSLSVNRPVVPGVVSYSSPQTLIGKRDMLIRHRSSVVGVQGFMPEHLETVYSEQNMADYAPAITPSTPSQSPYAMAADEVPLSKRRELMMRHSSLLSLSGNESPMMPYGMPQMSSSMHNILSQSPVPSADALPFDSHQPQRGPLVPSTEARHARLASFRNTVAADLRSGTPLGGRHTPTGRDSAESAHQVDVQRSIMLTQREVDMQRRDVERAERARNDQAFDEIMRRGDMIDAHRNALRRLQASAKDGSR